MSAVESLVKAYADLSTAACDDLDDVSAIDYDNAEHRLVLALGEDVQPVWDGERCIGVRTASGLLLLLADARTGITSERAVPPCPCACNSGGFCGGCGHAGCGRR